MDNLDHIKYNINRIREQLPKYAYEKKYIGIPINFQKIRNFILDEEIEEGGMIFVNSSNLVDLMEEYRKIYGTSMPYPYKFLGVLIQEAEGNSVPINRIGVIKN